MRQSAQVAGNEILWRAPVLHVRHWRTLFYGYDTVNYRLLARTSSAGKTGYQLSIEADYGGARRRYHTVKFPGASSRSTKDDQHEIERCQFFNSLVYACLFRDRARLELSASDLETARRRGLRLILSSGPEDYETLVLPAHYVEGFLQGIRS